MLTHVITIALLATPAVVLLKDKLFPTVPAAPKEAGPVQPIDKLISWLETKNPNEPYIYAFSNACLFGQFGRENGYGTLARSPYTDACIQLGGRTAPSNKDCVISEPFGTLAIMQPHTMGAALDRARAWKAAN